jgi:hypothetical protein
MMQLQRIAEETRISDSNSVKGALVRLRKVPEHELQFYLVLRDTLQATSAETRNAITLAQVESDRRANSRTRWLTITSTLISGAVGLIGVALGAYLTARGALSLHL